MPTSTIIMSSPSRTAMQLLPNSPSPPSGISSITLLTSLQFSPRMRSPSRSRRESTKRGVGRQYNTTRRPARRAPSPARSLLFRVRSSDGPRDSHPLLKRQRLRAPSRLNIRGFEHGRRAARRLDARAQVGGRGPQVVEYGLASLREARADDAP